MANATIGECLFGSSLFAYDEGSPGWWYYQLLKQKRNIVMFLPVNTAIVINVGPLIDDSDFKTIVTSIVYDSAGMAIDLIKSTETATTKVDLTLTTGGDNDWDHKGNGIYELHISAAQNDTLGSLKVVGYVDGCLPFESATYSIVPANVYDSFVKGTDTLDVNALTLADKTEMTLSSAYDGIGLDLSAVKAKTDNLPADPASNTQVNTRMATFSYTAPDNAGVASIKAKTDNLPADPASNTQVNTRMATFSYTAPDNAGITAIKAKTDGLNFTGTDVKATLDSEKVQVSGIDTDAITAASVKADAVTKVQSGLALESTLTAIKGAGWSAESLKAIKDAVDLKLSTLSYTAPDNASITAIKAKTDNLPADPASNTQVNTRMASFTYTAPDNASITAIKAKTDNLPADPASNTQVNTRMATFVYTAPDNADVQAIKTIADKLNTALELDGLNYRFTVNALENAPTTASTDISGLQSDVTTIKAQTDKIVFSGTDVKATLDGETVAVGDKTGFALTSAYDAAKTAATQTSVSLIPTNPLLTTDVRLNNLDTNIGSRMATFVYTAPDNADVQAIKTIVDKLNTAMELDGINYRFTVNALENAPVTASTDISSLQSDVTAVKAKTDNLPSDPASNTQVNTRMATFLYTAPDNAGVASIKAKTDNLPADPASNTQVNTRMATFEYTAPDNASITSIKSKTDGLYFDGTNVRANIGDAEVTVGTVNDKTDYSLTSAYDAAKSAASSGDSTAIADNVVSILNRVNTLPELADIVAGVLAGVVDGTVTLKDAQERLLACMVNKNIMATVGNNKVVDYKDSSGVNTVLRHTINEDGTTKDVEIV